MHAPCCTCGGCGIYSDTFSSSLAGSWTNSSGTWSTSGGELIGTGAGLLYNTTPDPDGVSQDVSLVLDYTFTLSGSNTFRFLISLLDTSNYLYAEITRDSSTGSTQVTLGEVLAGVDTPLSDTIPLQSSVSLGSEQRLYLCYYHSTGRLRFSGAGSFGDAGLEVDANGIGDKIGIQIVTGEGEFDDVSYGRAYSGDDLECEHCNRAGCSIGSFTGPFDMTGSVDPFFWETVTGSWGSNYVPSGDSILRFLRPHPLGKSTMHVTTTATITASGQTVRVYVNFLDEDNCLYADAGWDSTTVFRLSLYRVSSGTPTLLDERFVTVASPTFFNKNLRVTACYDGTNLSAEAFNFSTLELLHGSSAATEITDGKWAAIGSSGGPTFFRFLFQKYYSTTDPEDDDCPVCPEGCGCEASHVPRGNYTVDFGAGGWTDDGCDYCDQVAGEFVLGEWSDASGIVACSATYLDNNVCTYTACSVNDVNGLQIDLTLQSAGGGQLKWRLVVDLHLLAGDPGCPDQYAEAIYESAAFDTDECDVVPVTLSKVSETITEDQCNGSLPSTITIDET